jgi:hypothetical protein
MGRSMLRPYIFVPRIKCGGDFSLNNLAVIALSWVGGLRITLGAYCGLRLGKFMS